MRFLLNLSIYSWLYRNLRSNWLIFVNFDVKIVKLSTPLSKLFHKTNQTLLIPPKQPKTNPIKIVHTTITTKIGSLSTTQQPIHINFIAYIICVSKAKTPAANFQFRLITISICTHKLNWREYEKWKRNFF